MSPLVRYRHLSSAELGDLIEYVERSAEPPAPHHREAVIVVLRAAQHHASAPPSPPDNG